MWQPAALPFVRAGLDEMLPSVAQIRATTAVLSQRTGQSVVAVTPQILAKFGRSVKEREGQALLYLERHIPNAAAPRLYAMYYEAEELFIVMERICGTSLDILWGQLSEQRKTSVMKSLHRTFEHMRSAHCPWPDFLGAVDGGPISHHLFYCPDNDPNICGPFSNEASFNEGLVCQFRKLKMMNKEVDFKTYFYASHLDRVLKNHKPTFTHADVQRKNIIVVDGNDPDAEQVQVVVVDWEDAGWYPAYWEYFAAFAGFRWADDWCQRLEDAIPAWPAEAAVMKMMSSDLFF